MENDKKGNVQEISVGCRGLRAGCTSRVKGNTCLSSNLITRRYERTGRLKEASTRRKLGVSSNARSYLAYSFLAKKNSSESNRNSEPSGDSPDSIATASTNNTKQSLTCMQYTTKKQYYHFILLIAYICFVWWRTKIRDHERIATNQWTWRKVESVRETKTPCRQQLWWVLLAEWQPGDPDARGCAVELKTERLFLHVKVLHDIWANGVKNTIIKTGTKQQTIRAIYGHELVRWHGFN